MTSSTCNAAGDIGIGCTDRLPGEPAAAASGAPRRSNSTSGTMVTRQKIPIAA